MLLVGALSRALRAGLNLFSTQKPSPQQAGARVKARTASKAKTAKADTETGEAKTAKSYAAKSITHGYSRHHSSHGNRCSHYTGSQQKHIRA